MKKNLEPKTVECQCGNRIEMTQESDWCTKCVHKVFYDEKDQRRHRWDTLYMYGAILAVVSLLTYIFVALLLRIEF